MSETARQDEADPEPDPRPEQGQRVALPRELADPGIYREFRHQVARRQLLDSYFAALARALQFSGEVRIEFEGGQVLWTELREKWVDWPALRKRLEGE